ncbi:MAG: hypothetical protein ACLFRG_16245 [Desulfococcaceae bacterium]
MRFWKNLLLALFMAFALGIGAVGCEQKGPMEEAGEEMDEAVEEAGDSVEEAGDSVEETTDE